MLIRRIAQHERSVPVRLSVRRSAVLRPPCRLFPRSAQVGKTCSERPFRRDFAGDAQLHTAVALLAVLHEILIRSAHDINVVCLRNIEERERIKHILVHILHAELVLLCLGRRKDFSAVLIRRTNHRADIKILRMAGIDRDLVRRAIGKRKGRRCRARVHTGKLCSRSRLIRGYICRMVMDPKQNVPFIDRNGVDQRNALCQRLIIHSMAVISVRHGCLM